MANQLKDLNIEFTFFDAIDCKNAEAEPLFKLYSRDQFKKANPQYKKSDHLSTAEIACTLSHYGVAKKIVTEDIPWAIILEDDAVIRAQNLISLAKAAIHYAREREVILLNSWCQGVHVPSAKRLTGFPYTLHRPNRQTMLAGGLILSLAAAEAITSEVEAKGILRMNDWWIAKRVTDWSGIIHISVIKPDPVAQSKDLPSILAAGGRRGSSGNSCGDQDPWFGLSKNMVWSWKKPYRWPSNLNKMLCKVVSSFLVPPPRIH